MEQEGTVVYFKTSPSVKESQLTEEDLTFEEAIATETAQKLSEHNSTQSRLRKISNYVIKLAAPTCSLNRGNRWTRTWLISELKSSPLLTEEDNRILHFSLPHQPPPPSARTWQTSVVYYWMALMVALVATSLYMKTLTVIIVGLPLLILWGAAVLRSRYHQKRMVHLWQEYSQKCEEMLSSLTKALCLIQEMEVLSRGYSRPSRVVPVSRLEFCEGTNLQCIFLRRRVFRVSLTGILLLRTVTKKLCTLISIKEELDSIHSYLAFRDLEGLHEYMREGSIEEEECRGSEKLSLESLKDACNLLAVQNSEYLRRLGLVLSFSTDTHTNLPLSKSCLPEVLQFVRKACEDLEWSLQYQKNFLFGEPPTKKKKTTKPSYHPDLQPFVEEIHCLDLKLQLTLQNVRALGELLAERYSSGKRPSDEELKEVCEQLTTVESYLARTNEHISGGMATLDQLITPLPVETVAPQENVLLPTDSEPINEDNELTEEPFDEDVLVFEAYIPLDAPDEEHSEEDHLTMEERQRLEEAKEVPANLLRELNSVLTVRNEVREKKREEKRAKKLKQSLSSPQNSDKTDLQDQQLSIEVEKSDYRFEKMSTRNRNEVVSECCERPSQTEENTTHGRVLSEILTKEAASQVQLASAQQDNDIKEGNGFSTDRPTQFLDTTGRRSLAQAVAAVALKHRKQTEVIFEHKED